MRMVSEYRYFHEYAAYEICLRQLWVMPYKGSVHIVKEDFWGNRNIIARIGAGQIFAETYACLGMEEFRKNEFHLIRRQ